ncbi:alpha/beta hydrolase [Micromonospora sp. KC606]|uniref:alpha/beta hydrolase family protein n=1 Tax=Micromonospora sp. KC606 TaxID=2530379 RepID=UPI0010433A62|nr:alpha/beta hydrolase [Micromonospora sp. KC606]TDC80619.1 alpha/beta hydrolase [Micromonospora sp. KC606]
MRTKPWRRRLLLTATALTVIATVAALTSVAFANPTNTPSGNDSSTPAARAYAGPSAALYLPRPTGRHPVGATALYLKDTSRPDPWVAEANARELMVSLWYPARFAGKRRALYMTATESELLLKDGGIAGVPYDALSKVRTNAFTDVVPAGRPRALPLVVLSPGFTKPRSTLTAWAEDLASHGYLVAGIEHTYESVATTFPDGRVTTCAACELPDRTEEFWKEVGRVRAADVSFVLDELTGSRPAWQGASLIDPSRIAMAGHSAGGASALAAMAADTRLRAGIDIDGLTHDSVPYTELSRPFLFLGRQGNFSPGMPSAVSWERDWARLTGWKRWLLVAGAQHASFTDVALLAEQVGLDIGADLPANRAMEITRAYVRAFFDLHLRNPHQSILNGPSPRYPEVTFCAPEARICR